MRHPIKLQRIVPPEKWQRGESFRKIHLLKGEVEGVETSVYCQRTGTKISPEVFSGRAHVYFFVEGSAEIRTRNRSFSIWEMAAFYSPLQDRIVIEAASTLQYLEILFELREGDFNGKKETSEFFITYSGCEPYTEAIKSPNTISRTITPTHVVPRFCMGSVEGKGPAQVASHEHPMLEQFFLGLLGNKCTVIADDAQALFEEKTLLHIPLGSWHGVNVKEGETMHYVWMDFFENAEEMAWIDEQHKPIRK